MPFWLSVLVAFSLGALTVGFFATVGFSGAAPGRKEGRNPLQAGIAWGTNVFALGNYALVHMPHCTDCHALHSVFWVMAATTV